MSQSVPKPSWKQEVNRRLEAHKSRKGPSIVDDTPIEEHSHVSDRAARAAARVAARFSSAPSYSEMQAAEARAALREAEAATRAALEAQAAAQVALANLERASEEEEEIEYEPAASVQRASVAPPPPTWDPEPDSPEADAFDAPLPGVFARVAAPEQTEAASAEIDEPRHLPAAPPLEEYATPYAVEPEPIHANLIHFPRELVATRRMRPRLTASPEPPAAEQVDQLSIFEVDPTSISTEPMESGAETAAPAPSWSGPDWSGAEAPHAAAEADTPSDSPSAAATIDLAPLELRLMASTIDLALIVCLVCAAAAGLASHLPHMPSMRVAEIATVAALVFVGMLYQAFFLLVAKGTPGMMYARISLCTFDDEHPTHNQLRERLWASLVSLLPMGLGLAWAIFDEDHLTWHDRISRTYQRRY